MKKYILALALSCLFSVASIAADATHDQTISDAQLYKQLINHTQPSTSFIQLTNTERLPAPDPGTECIASSSCFTNRECGSGGLCTISGCVCL